MVTLDTVYKILPKAKNVELLTINNQSTNDIIKQVITQHKQNIKQAKLIAHLFDSGDAYGTCQNIWNFLKYEIPYSVEPSNKQTTKTLSRIIYDAKFNTGKNDCKHYSGFTGAILDVLGYNFIYRFAGYSKYLNMPTHVYVVCENKIFVDAVINGFDIEKPYKLKIDKKMSLYQLSGLDEIGSVKKRLQNVGKKISQGAQTIKQGALTVSLAIPRNAFLLLLRFNVNGWATGLSRSNFNDLKWWLQLGGNRTELLEAIKAGASKKRIFGIEDTDTMIGIGEPVTIAAALTSSAPIILKVKSLLEKAEIAANKVEGIKKFANKTQNLADQAKSGFKQITGKEVTDIIYKKDAGITGSNNSLIPSDFTTPTDMQAEKVANAFNKPKLNNKLLLIGGVGIIAAAFLLKRK